MTDNNKRILIVGDLETSSAKIIEYLEKKQNDVFFMGAENAISEKIIAVEPDIIVLHLGEYEHNCSGIVGAIKSSTLTGNIPVICLSGQVDLSHRLRCLSSGVNDFLLKPICLPELLARIYVQLESAQKLDKEMMQSRISELVDEATPTPGLAQRQPDALLVEGLDSEELYCRIETMLKTRLEDHPKPALLAQEIGCSLKHLNDLFRKRTGKTLSAYILDLKMTTARDWVIGSQLRINEIAKRLGYEHPGDFSRAFTRRWSSSPRKYRLNAVHPDRILTKPSYPAQAQLGL